ncbi:LysR family transcriptional regulator [Paraburkholderia sediminicola]|uniref:LysR family transcriptional regulator n=1 Tax=Paraburkholderia sediminicola TaxID=458836 RepID=UPI0038B7CD2F
MNTTFLETLVWLTRLKSFSRTAEKLHTSQPSISNRINKLEDVLRIQIYDRSAKQFELTPAGRRIYNHAEAIVSLSLELVELAASDEYSEHHVRIGAIEFVTMSWLPAFLNEISSSFPKATFEITTGTSSDLLERLQKGEIDLAFLVGPVNEPNIASHGLCNMNLSWLANPNKYDCARPIDIAELAELPIVMARPGTSGYEQLIDYFRLAGVTHIPKRHSKIILNCIYSFSTARQIILSGLGVIASPTFLARDDIATGRMAIVPVRQAPPTFHVFACLKKPVTNVIIDSLVAIANNAIEHYIADQTKPDIWR